MKYLIIKLTDLDKVDFSQILQTNEDTILPSKDNLYTIIKWVGEDPDFLNLLTDSIGPFTKDIIIDEMKKLNWFNEEDNE